MPEEFGVRDSILPFYLLTPTHPNTTRKSVCETRSLCHLAALVELTRYSFVTRTPSLPEHAHAEHYTPVGRLCSCVKCETLRLVSSSTVAISRQPEKYSGPALTQLANTDSIFVTAVRPPLAL